MLRPEPLDIMIIALVALLLFGANRLPETARAMGKGIREFRAAITGQDGSDASREEASRLTSTIPMAKTEAQTTASCKNCSKPIQPGSKFCPECGAGLFVLESGWEKAIKTAPNEREQVMRFAGRGEVFNKVGIMADSPNVVTIVA